MELLTKNTRIVYLYEKQNHKCTYCGGLFYCDGNITTVFNIDHDIPTSRGGKDTIDNIVLSCVSCNSTKANMTGDEFREIMLKVKQGKVDKKDLGDYAKYLVLKSKFKE